MMYLLLRDNKQSGPYSLDELKTMGLKAYDLVWIEGKSAAWRYPCEIDELSAFAPAVEEQPFDRFYKKTSSVKTNANSATTVSTSPTSNSSRPAGEPSTVPGKRIIYVTMPAGSRPGTIVPPVRETNREVVSRDIPREAPREIPRDVVPETPRQAAREIIHEITPLEDISSQPLAESASTMEFLPHSGRRRTSPIVKPLAIGLTVLALLAAGIFIGLSISKEGGFQQRIVAKTAGIDNGQQAHTTAQQLPVPAVQKDPVPVSTESKPDTVATIVGQASTPATTAPPVIRSPRVSAPKERSSGPKAQALPPTVTKDTTSGIPPIVHREAVHRSDVEEKQETANNKEDNGKASIASQVSVGANGYTVGTFGGIADLQVTVTNHSAYPLDLVVVEVQYIQANKKIYKTENLYFRGIAAGSALMQEAPKSSRGVKVQYKITMINSKEPGLSYSGI